VRVTIKGLRRTFYPPIHHAPMDSTPPEKKMQLEWVYPLKFINLETCANSDKRNLFKDTDACLNAILFKESGKRWFNFNTYQLNGGLMTTP
jgi:hypothetical protein